jgi:hypothetical protein
MLEKLSGYAAVAIVCYVTGPFHEATLKQEWALCRKKKNVIAFH